MNWNEVYEWLKSHGHINDEWENIAVTDDGFYAEDKMENTFISLFTRGSDDELVFYVGCLRPKVSVGSCTGLYVSHSGDVIGFLEDHLEYMYDALMRKVMENNG